MAACYSHTDMDARNLRAFCNSMAPTTTSPVAGNSLRTRLPVFGPLRRLVGLLPWQEHRLLGQANDGALCTGHKPSPSPLSSPLASSGQTTPGHHSPTTLDLTPVEYSASSQYCNDEDSRSSAAEMAVRLWMMARDPVRCPDPRWQTKARTMQIDAVRYMHMALPSDLSLGEAALIRATIPRQVLSDQSPSHHDLKPTALRRSVAQVVASLMALFVFLLPLLTSLANILLRYERELHLTERILVCVQGTVRGLGQHGAHLQSSLVGFLNSSRGRRLMASGVYLVEGIAGGVMDGCGYQDTPTGARGFSWTDPQTVGGFPVQSGRQSWKYSD